MIVVENRKKKRESIELKYPGAVILDVTSKSDDQTWVYLSPFYPHGGIPVPFSEGWEAQSVEGIWQGLKVFENTGVDQKKFFITNMTDLKRGATKATGAIRGHQKGMDSKEILDYITARKLIYVPTYEWILKNRCQQKIEQLMDYSYKYNVVLLDYDTNGDIEDPSSPLSHASLIVRYVWSVLSDEEKAEWEQQRIENEKKSEEAIKQFKKSQTALKKAKDEHQSFFEAALDKDNPSPYNIKWVREQQESYIEKQLAEGTKKKDLKEFSNFLFFWSHKAPVTFVYKGSEKVRERVTDKSCFSQWFPITFEVDGILYNCAEQYMMAEKARLFGDDETLEKIMDCTSTEPNKMQQLGREVKNFDPEIWNANKFNIVVKGNLAKFRQNEKETKYLLRNQSRILVEASPRDRVWGIGMRENDKGCNDVSKWLGSNLLGFALMVVRDQLIKELA